MAHNLLKIVEQDAELRNKISPQGWDWLIAVLDPFHDFEHALSGYPDLAGAPSVVMEVTRTATISGAQVPTGEAYFFLCPYEAQQVASSPVTARLSEGAVQQIGPIPPANSVFGGNPGSPTTALVPLSFTGSRFLSGGLCFSNQQYSAATFSLVDSMTPDSIILAETGTIMTHGITAPHRVIGAGFQVTNTTAPLYKSGNVVVFDTPTNWSPVSFSANTNDAPSSPTQFIYYNYDAVACQGPPTTLGQAIQQSGAKQFGAEEGCYCVAKFNNFENPVTSTLNAALNSGVIDGTGCTNIIVGVPASVNTLTPPTGGYNSLATPNTQFMLMSSKAGGWQTYPFNGVGAYFTGLDIANTSLQVTCKWFVEVFPNPYFDSALMPIVTPSAPFDPLAMEVYARVVNQLPGGVAVRDNFLGIIGSAIGGLAKSAINAIAKPHISNPVEPWDELIARYHGDAGAAVHDQGGGINKFTVDAMRDRAKENLNKRLPLRSGVNSADIAFNYPFWFGDGNYPTDNLSHTPSPDMTSYEQSQVVGAPCAARVGSERRITRAPVSDPYYNFGYMTGPDAVTHLPYSAPNLGGIDRSIQSAVDRGINSALRRLGVTTPMSASVRMPAMIQDMDDGYGMEASEAVKARRRLARRNRTLRLQQCRAAMPQLFPAPRPNQSNLRPTPNANGGQQYAGLPAGRVAPDGTLLPS
jgi:hypothetical protein